MILAAEVSWEGIAAVLAAAGTAFVGWLTYRKGTKADEALNLSAATAANLEAQRLHIDNLQEDVDRYRGIAHDCESELDAVRKQLREVRHDLGDTKAALAAAEVVIARLERRATNQQAEIAALRDEMEVPDG